MPICLSSVLAACLLLAVGGCHHAPASRESDRQVRAAVNRRAQAQLARAEQDDIETLLELPVEEDDMDSRTPVRLDKESIVRLVFERSPLVLQEREAMLAAQYGLEEFIANLSRFEPFVEARGDLSDYPERREAEGRSGEVVGGVEKETYDGAIIRFEGGLSGQNVKFGEVDEGQDEVESGEGGVFRARLEVPFAGSRRRQNRVINQAFQKSTARKAVLNYVSRFRTYANQAMNQYRRALLYQNYREAYIAQAERLEALLDDARVREEDRRRLTSSAADSRLVAQQYDTTYQRSVLHLLQRVGLTPDAEFELVEPDALPSPYLDRARTQESRLGMLQEAFDSNPTFAILEDAIADTELQRSQAITGDFDITAFVEATQFAFGSVSYDDRVDGWQVGVGVTVRLNDTRVLNATKLKTEAEIRGFRADIETQKLSLERQITTQSDKLVSYAESLAKIEENLQTSHAEVQTRIAAYLDPANEEFKIDDVIRSLSTHTSTRVRLAANIFNFTRSEDVLMTSTGEVYRMVGMESQLAEITPDAAERAIH